MRVSLSWLREHVDLDGVSVEELCERLTTAGVEVDAVEPTGGLHPEVVVAVVLSVERPEPGWTWLSLAAGGAAPLRVVSRAPNLGAVAAGTRLALARPGAVIFEWREGVPKPKKVTAAKLKVGVSEGVGCSALELGIGQDHSGVLLLEGPGAPPLPEGLRLVRPGAPAGAPLSEALAWGPDVFADIGLELAILPNIARCQSLLGVAREVGALLDRPTRLSVPLRGLGGALDFGRLSGVADDTLGDWPQDDALRPISNDRVLCDRFGVLRVEGLRVGPSPAWVQRRLVASGLSPVNNVVDASNLAMIELGQPTHAYDLAALPALPLRVERAGPGARFKALIAEDAADALPVAEGSPVICSGGAVVALAGVMGGHGARVTEATTSLLLESANFDFISVRKSQQASQTFSDSSARFSRGVDPALVTVALRRIVHLLAETNPALVVSGAALLAGAPLAARPLRLDLQRLQRALGVEAGADEVKAALDRAGLPAQVEAGGASLGVSVPTGRQDIEREADLWEEVARLLGYDRLPSTMPIEPIPSAPTDRRLLLREALVDLAVREGLQETQSYTLTSPELEAKLWAGRAAAAPRYAQLQNAGSVERRALRRTLLAHLLDCAAYNQRHSPAVHIFEQGVVVLPELPGIMPGLPGERERLSVLMMGPVAPAGLHEPSPRDADVHDIAAVVAELLAGLHVGPTRLAQVDAAPFHPGIGARVLADGPDGEVELGVYGQVHPSVAAAFDLAGRVVLAAELDVDAITARSARFFFAPGPPRFPEISIDIAVLVGEAVSAGALCATTAAAGAPLLREVVVFDVYRGRPVPEGQVAVGLRLRLGADRTLEMREAEALREAVVAALGLAHGAALRV